MHIEHSEYILSTYVHCYLNVYITKCLKKRNGSQIGANILPALLQLGSGENLSIRLAFFLKYKEEPACYTPEPPTQDKRNTMEQQQVQPPPYQPEPAQPAPPEPQAHQAPQQFDARQLFAYIQHLEGQIQALQAHPPAPVPNLNAGLKPTKLPPFKGKLSKSVDSWIFQVKQYNLVVPMAADRLIPFVASYLTEHAAIW